MASGTKQIQQHGGDRRFTVRHAWPCLWIQIQVSKAKIREFTFTKVPGLRDREWLGDLLSLLPDSSCGTKFKESWSPGGERGIYYCVYLTPTLTLSSSSLRQLAGIYDKYDGTSCIAEVKLATRKLKNILLPRFFLLIASARAGLRVGCGLLPIWSQNMHSSSWLCNNQVTK